MAYVVLVSHVSPLKLLLFLSQLFPKSPVLLLQLPHLIPQLPLLLVPFGLLPLVGGFGTLVGGFTDGSIGLGDCDGEIKVAVVEGIIDIFVLFVPYGIVGTLRVRSLRTKEGWKQILSWILPKKAG